MNKIYYLNNTEGINLEKSIFLPPKKNENNNNKQSVNNTDEKKI